MTAICCQSVCNSILKLSLKQIKLKIAFCSVSCLIFLRYKNAPVLHYWGVSHSAVSEYTTVLSRSKPKGTGLSRFFRYKANCQRFWSFLFDSRNNPARKAPFLYLKTLNVRFDQENDINLFSILFIFFVDIGKYLTTVKPPLYCSAI